MTGNLLLYDCERKHLMALEMRRLIAATQGSRNEARDPLPFASHVPAPVAGIGSQSA